jgi:hypothetical protein
MDRGTGTTGIGALRKPIGLRRMDLWPLDEGSRPYFYICTILCIFSLLLYLEDGGSIFYAKCR